MSLHLGIHWGRVVSFFRKSFNDNKKLLWVQRIAAVVIAGYGLGCFIQNQIVSYMFLQTHFVFFDYEKTILQVFLEYIGMMGFWVFAGYCISKILIGGVSKWNTQ